MLLFLIAVPFFVHALERDALISQYVRDKWDTGYSLPSDTLRSVIQTKDGYIWLATSAGLVKFDGLGFTLIESESVPELSVSSITVLLEDRDGSVWIGTEGAGLLRKDKSRFQVFTMADGLSDDFIVALAQDREGTIWIGTSAGLTSFKKGEFVSHPLDKVHSLFADASGMLIGTENGLSVAESGKWVNYPGNSVTAVYRNRKGEILLGVKGEGLFRMHNGEMSLLMQSEMINSILEDRDQNIWIGTNEGLQRLSDLSFYREIRSPVSSLLEDREGSLWITTEGDGLHRFKPTAFIMFARREGLLDQRSWCVFQDNSGSMWVGTDRGVSRWQDREFTRFPVAGPVKAIAGDECGAIWISTSTGIMRWNGSDFVLVVAGVQARAILVDSIGTVWVGADDGLRKLEGGKLTPPEGDPVTDLHFHEGTLWVGTATGLKEMKNGSLQESSITDPVFCIQHDRAGNLWIATDRAVHSIRQGRLYTYTRANGLHHDRVYSILQDDNGALWMSGPRGVFRAELKDERFSSLAFGVAHGLKSTDCAIGNPASLRSSDGKFWFATAQGTAVIDPIHYFRNSILPTVTMEKVFVDRVPLVDIEKPDLKFPARTSRIEFHYAASSYLPQVRFRYVLQGYDQFWLNVGTQRSALYTNLSPGKYRFKVLVCNNDSLWNTNAASFSFEIENPKLSFNWTSVVLPVIAAILGFGAGWLARQRYTGSLT